MREPRLTNPAGPRLVARSCAGQRDEGWTTTCQSATPDERAPRCVDVLVPPSRGSRDFPPGAPCGNPIGCRGVRPAALPTGREGASSDGDALVADQAQPYGSGSRTIEEVRLDRLEHVLPQLLPGIALGDDRLGQALRHVTTIGILGDLEDELVVHGPSVPPANMGRVAAPAGRGCCAVLHPRAKSGGARASARISRSRTGMETHDGLCGLRPALQGGFPASCMKTQPRGEPKTNAGVSPVDTDVLNRATTSGRGLEERLRSGFTPDSPARRPPC